MKHTLILIAMLLTACDQSPPPQPKTESPATPIFDTQIKALEKAKAVDGQVMDAAEAQRKQVEDATH